MTTYADFLADPNRRDVWVVQLSGREIESDTSRSYYFATRRYATGPDEDLVANIRCDALVIGRPAITHELQGASGVIAGLLPASTGGTVRLRQRYGNLDLGTLPQLNGVPLHGITFGGRTIRIYHGGYSPRLGRWLRLVDEMHLEATGTIVGEPEVNLEEAIFTFASRDKNFEYPAQTRTYFGLGDALYFDGTNDSIDCGNHAEHNFTAGDFTVEFPLYFESNPAAEKTIVGRGEINVDGWQVVRDTSGRIGLRTNQSGASQLSVSSAVTNGRYGWGALVSDGATVTVYIDGVASMVTSATHVNPTTASRSLWIGRNDGGTQFAQMLLAEVRVWNVARTSEEINACMGRPLTADEIDSTLVLYLKLQDGTGTTAADASDTGADGTISGATWCHSGTGQAELAGEKLEDLWGPVRGWEPTLLDSNRSIYFLSSLSIQELEALEIGGAGPPVGPVAATPTTSLFTLLTTSPGAGKYQLCTTAGGSWIRCGSRPQKRPTVEVKGNAPGGVYLENAADQVRYIVCNRGPVPLADPADIDTTAFSDLESANASPCGHGWRGDVSVAEMIAVPLKTVGAVGWFKNAGKFSVKRNEGASVKTASLTIRKVTRGSLTAQPRSVPLGTATLLYQRNYSVMGAGELYPDAIESGRNRFFAREWRKASASDAAVREDFRNAKTMELETGFDDYDDAWNEATRLLALYGTPDQAFQIHVPITGLEVERMDAVYLHLFDLSRERLRQDRLGTSATAKFLIFDKAPDATGVWLSLWREEIV